MIYLDNAATSFPKPDAVLERIAFAMRELGGNPGRSSHRLSMLADREVYACRCAAAELFDCAPERVIFTYNATYALNMAIKTAYSQGGIAISDLEHNSVRRPALAMTRDVRLYDSHLELSGEERVEAILRSARSKLVGASLLVATAQSNICGATLPIRELGALCRERGVKFVVDGAQAAGTRKISMREDNIDLLCIPGHKGLYGPQGSGMLILGENVRLPTLLEGGSGSGSLSSEMPELPPERYEAGTLAVPAIAGLRVGIEYVKSVGEETLHKHGERLARSFAERLRRLGGVRLYEPLCARESPGTVVLFKLAGIEPEAAARALDAMGICLRAGYHCAPLAHQRLGTGSAGALRASFGSFNRDSDVEEAASAVASLLKRR